MIKSIDIGHGVDAEEIRSKNQWALAEINLERFCKDSDGECCAKCEHWRFDQTGVTGECVNSKNMSGRDRIQPLGLTNYTGPIPEPGPLITDRSYLCELFEGEEKSR